MIQTKIHMTTTTMMNRTFIILFLFITFSVNSQNNPPIIHKYAVYFKDKEHSLDSFDFYTYFSERAIYRRSKNKSEFSFLDLPVSKKNIEQLKNLNTKIIGVSRWKNCAVIQTNDTLDLMRFKTYDWVEKVEYIYRGKHPKTTIDRKTNHSSEYLKQKSKFKKGIFRSTKYWKTFDQADMLRISALHNENAFAKDIHIAIFDGGFANVDQISAFKHLFDEKRILKTWDFVSQEAEVYGDGDHGTRVLSCMAGFEKNKFLGLAPKASFYLFRTEDGWSETIMEEYHWLFAAEFADSAGVDVVNSSLGYTSFDSDQPVNYSYNYTKLNGQVGIASFAATQLAQRGVAVCNSAGNSGNDPWTFIGVPADAKGIFSVGGVDRDLQKASFSSFGPTADGRIKPDISALGLSSCVIGSDGTVSYSSGTSFSSPIFCGALACLIGANYNVPLQSIYEAVIKTASQSKNPDNYLGYGIPNFQAAQGFIELQKK